MFFCLLSAACAVHAAKRDKTDRITLQNGDQITCEILSLEYGILQVDTSNMGTLSIEWPAVKVVTSGYTFALEDAKGERHFGHIAMSEGGATLEIEDPGGVVRLPMLSVVRLSQVELDFWKRIHGSLAVGFNFAKASQTSINSLDFQSTYRTERLESELNISTIVTKSRDNGTSDRDRVANTVRFLQADRNFLEILSAWGRNPDLGFETRVQLGGAFGRHFSQSSSSELTGFVGVSLNQERATGANGWLSSGEGVLGIQWRVYRFNFPATRLSTGLVFFPSLTESGRYRGEFNGTLTRDLIKDLTLNLQLYGSYDSQPPDPTVSKSDYGAVMSLGYKF